MRVDKVKSKFSEAVRTNMSKEYYQMVRSPHKYRAQTLTMEQQLP